MRPRAERGKEGVLDEFDERLQSAFGLRQIAVPPAEPLERILALGLKTSTGSTVSSMKSCWISR